MVAASPFREAETWIFDLDNTLYPPSARLFDQINVRMTAFIARELRVSDDEADSLRARLWAAHGTTLRGLTVEHGVEPHGFLAEVHEIDLAAIRPDPALVGAVAGLRGRKLVHTNGSREHARRVLAATGLSRLIDRVFALEDKAFVPKPHPDAYQTVLSTMAFDPARAVMVEDDPANLVEPKRLGMATVWVSHDAAAEGGGHVDRRITDLAEFLSDPR